MVLANLFSDSEEYPYKLKISGRAKCGKGGRPKSPEIKHWSVLQEYLKLRSNMEDAEARTYIVNHYKISQEDLGTAINAYRNKEMQNRLGYVPKRSRGRPKKY